MSIKDDIQQHPLIHLLPQYYQNKEDFLVFVKLFFDQYDISERLIREFTNLINNDKVPMKFLEALGAYVDYTYQPLASNEFNRELSMRMLKVWEERGTKKAILDAAMYGNNNGWVGGDLWIPGYYKPGQVADISLPRDKIFRHSISPFSGTHVFEDGKTYMPGVIRLSLPFLNKRIKKRIYDVTPAGRRYIFEIESAFYPNDPIDPLDIGGLNELSFYKRMRVKPILQDEYTPQYDRDTDIDFRYIINMGVENEQWDILIHSRNDVGKPYHSGRIKLTTEFELERAMAVSTLPVNTLSQPFEVNHATLSPNRYKVSPTGEYVDTQAANTADHIQHNIDNVTNLSLEVHAQYKGVMRPSTVKYGAHSDKHTLSGLDIGEITLYVGRTLDPYDAVHSVDEIADKYWFDSVEENETTIEIDTITGNELTGYIEEHTHTELEAYSYNELADHLYNKDHMNSRHSELATHTHSELHAKTHGEM